MEIERVDEREKMISMAHRQRPIKRFRWLKDTKNQAISVVSRCGRTNWVCYHSWEKIDRRRKFCLIGFSQPWNWIEREKGFLCGRMDWYCLRHNHWSFNSPIWSTVHLTIVIALAAETAEVALPLKAQSLARHSVLFLSIKSNRSANHCAHFSQKEQNLFVHRVWRRLRND